jgi:hypothetical protein
MNPALLSVSASPKRAANREDGREHIVLKVPARPENVRLVRLVMATVGSRIGFGLEVLDDLRIAVNELCFCLMGGEGTSGDLTVAFVAIADCLVVEGSVSQINAANTPEALPLDLPELSQRIFEALTSSYIGELDGTHRWLTFTRWLTA